MERMFRALGIKYTDLRPARHGYVVDTYGLYPAEEIEEMEDSEGYRYADRGRWTDESSDDGSSYED